MSLSDSTTRSLQIVAGSSGTTFDGTNTFTYKLPSSGYTAGRDEVALKSLTLYYSWFNITSAKGNNSFSYIWPDGGATYPVVLADGIWSYADFYSYLQQVMVANGHYLVDAAGTKVYYINIAENDALYCLSLIITPLPAVLPAGWTNPANVNLTTAAGKGPQLIIPATPIRTYTGFAAGTYPTVASTSVYTTNSAVPQVTDAPSLNVLCNLVDSTGFSLSTNILTSFVLPKGTLPGDLVEVKPTFLDWVPVRQGQTYTEITVQLTDQLIRPLILNDAVTFVATLYLRKRL